MLIEEYRTKEELASYFKNEGIKTTEDDLFGLKAAYQKDNKLSKVLTLHQLNNVAGGGPGRNSVKAKQKNLTKGHGRTTCSAITKSMLQMLYTPVKSDPLKANGKQMILGAKERLFALTEDSAMVAYNRFYGLTRFYQPIIAQTTNAHARNHKPTNSHPHLHDARTSKHTRQRTKVSKLKVAKSSNLCNYRKIIFGIVTGVCLAGLSAGLIYYLETSN